MQSEFRLIKEHNPNRPIWINSMGQNNKNSVELPVKHSTSFSQLAGSSNMTDFKLAQSKRWLFNFAAAVLFR